MTTVADQMKVSRMTIGGLEPRTTLAEVHLAGHACSDHPLQRPVDRRAADSRILAANELEELVGAQMTLLPQKDV